MFLIDMREDLGEIAGKMLMKRGIRPDPSWDDHMRCIKLYDIRRRRFDMNLSYLFVLSDKLTEKLRDHDWATNILQCEEGVEPKLRKPFRITALEDFLIRLWRGETVTAYLGRDVNKTAVKKSDFQLKNWGIHHAHLDLDLASGKYTDGKDAKILFFYVRGRMVHLIDIKPHPFGAEWFDPDLLETIYRNWPWLMQVMPGVTALEYTPTREEHYELSKNVTVFYELKKGLIICPTTFGVVTSGDSLEAVRTTDHILNDLNLNKLEIEKKEHQIRKEYERERGDKLPETVRWRLSVSEDHYFQLYPEADKNFVIRLFAVPDVFYER